MGDLKEVPAVHFNFPLLSFYLYTTFKTGIAASSEPIGLGGLVNGNEASVSRNIFHLFVSKLCWPQA